MDTQIEVNGQHVLTSCPSWHFQEVFRPLLSPVGVKNVHCQGSGQGHAIWCPPAGQPRDPADLPPGAGASSGQGHQIRVCGPPAAAGVHGLRPGGLSGWALCSLHHKITKQNCSHPVRNTAEWWNMGLLWWNICSRQCTFTCYVYFRTVFANYSLILDRGCLWKSRLLLWSCVKLLQCSALKFLVIHQKWKQEHPRVSLLPWTKSSHLIWSCDKVKLL